MCAIMLVGLQSRGPKKSEHSREKERRVEAKISNELFGRMRGSLLRGLPRETHSQRAEASSLSLQVVRANIMAPMATGPPPG